MRKLFNLRVEVVTGILAAAVLVGILAVSGVPSMGVAQGATNLKDGFTALSAAVTGQDTKADSNDRSSWKGEHSARRHGGESKGLSTCGHHKPRTVASAASGTTPACDGNKKDCDKKVASSTCPMASAKAAKAMTSGCCPKSKPAQDATVKKDSAESKLAKAE